MLLIEKFEIKSEKKCRLTKWMKWKQIVFAKKKKNRNNKANGNWKENQTFIQTHTHI